MVFNLLIWHHLYVTARPLGAFKDYNRCAIRKKTSTLSQCLMPLSHIYVQVQVQIQIQIRDIVGGLSDVNF
jgi:hypothetical protein